MRIGLFIAVGGSSPIDDVVAEAVRAEADGFDSAWVSNIFALEGLTVCAVAGRATSRIELGTAVVPTYPRHPSALAQQALTVQAACGNRLALGIGLSHRMVIEGMLGLDYSKPVRHMREYLTVLNDLLGPHRTQFQGEEFRVRLNLTVRDAQRPPVLVAALGPQMLALAGRLADGTSTWMGGPRYLESRAVPIITKAAADAGRPAPRIVCGCPVAVTSDADNARAAAAQQFAMYGTLPSYRAALDVEGSTDVTGACVIGDESSVGAQLDRLASVGVTDLNAAMFAVRGDPDAQERTRAFLADYNRR